MVINVEERINQAQYILNTGKLFEIYSEMAEIIKGCKTDSNGTVVQGNHKYYRSVLLA